MNSGFREDAEWNEEFERSFGLDYGFGAAETLSGELLRFAAKLVFRHAAGGVLL